MKSAKFLGILLTVLAIGLIGVTGWAAETFTVTVEAPTPVVAGDLIQVKVTYDDGATGGGANFTDGTITITSDKEVGDLLVLTGVTLDHDESITAWTTSPVTEADDDHTITASGDDGIIFPTGNTALQVDGAEAVEYVATSGGTVEAGAQLTITITAKDRYGNTATYAGDVAITVTSNKEIHLVYDGTATFTAGVATCDTNAGATGLVTATADAHTLTVTGDFTATCTVMVTAGAAASMQIAPALTPIECGDALTINVSQVKDQYGNLTGENLTKFSIFSDKDGDLATPGGVTITGGAGTFDIDPSKLVTLGTHGLSAYADGVPTATTSVVVNAIATTLVADDKLPATAGDTFAPSATVSRVSSAGAVPDGGEVVFSYSTATDITAAIAGGAGVATGGSNFTEDGTATYDAAFAQQTIGGLVYAASTDTANVYVGGKASSLVITDPGPQVAGVAFSVTATLTGSDIEGARIDFELDGDTAFDMTDSSGEATVSLTPSLSGARTINASFAGGTFGGTRYQPSSGTQAVTVAVGPLDSVTIAGAENASGLGATAPIESGNKVKLVQILLKDAEDNPIISEGVGNVSLSAETNAQAPAGITLVDVVTIPGYGTDASGYVVDDAGAAIYIAEGQLTAIATHAVTVFVTLGGVTKHNNPTPPPSFEIVVNKRSTELSALSSVSATPGQKFDVQATLKGRDSAGVLQLLGTKPVKFTYNTDEIITDTGTGGTLGVADTANETAQFTAPTTPGSSSYTADFVGDALYAAAPQQLGTVEVSASSATSIEVKNIPQYAEKAIAFDVTILGRDSNNNPAVSTVIQGFKVVSDKEGEVVAASDLLLDHNGEATFQVTLATAGTHTLTFYRSAGAYSTTASITVTKTTTLQIDVSGVGSLAYSENFVVQATLDGSAVVGRDVTLSVYTDPDDDTTCADGSLPSGTTTDDVLVSSVTDATDADGLATGTFAAPYSNDALYVVAQFAGDSEYYASVDSDKTLGRLGLEDNLVSIVPAVVGWSMVSVTAEPEKTTPGDLLGDNAGALFRWDPTSSYLQGNQAGPVSPMSGYWFYASPEIATTELVADANDSGYAVKGDVTITLAASGWHMISSPFDVGWGDVTVAHDGTSEVTVEDAQAAGWMSKWLVSYNPDSDEADASGYVWADAPGGTITGSGGFWIQVKEAGAGLTLTLPFEPGGEPVPSGLSLAALGFGAKPAGVPSPPPPPNAALMQSIELNAISTPEGVLFEASGISGIEALSVEVFNLAGELVYAGSAQGASLNWSAQGVANGVYLYVPQVKIAGGWQSLGLNKLLILR